MAFVTINIRMTTPMSPTTVNTPATAALFEKKPLAVALLNAAAEGVLVVLSDTTVVETSVITAGKAVVGVRTFGAVVGVIGVVEVVVSVELELLEPLVLEEVEEEEVELAADDDEEVVGFVADVGAGWDGIRPIAVELDVLDVDEVVSGSGSTMPVVSLAVADIMTGF
jgi:hypothetical protein